MCGTQDVLYKKNLMQNSHSNNFQIIGIWETKYKMGLTWKQNKTRKETWRKMKEAGTNGERQRGERHRKRLVIEIFDLIIYLK